MLLLTCFVASPFIYKQIWKNSSVKAGKTSTKPPVITTQPAQSAPADPNAETQPTSEGETAAATAANAENSAPVQQSQFVQSGKEYFDDALFIGDSRTVGIRDYGTLKNADYFCNVGLQAYQIDNTTENGKTVWTVLNEKQYGKIYIMLGINEVGNNYDVTLTAYKKLVDGIKEVQPNALIFIQANLHVASFAETAAISNERINTLNSSLSELADNSRVFFIDANPVFDNEYGALPDDMTSDGIHFLAKYYTTWCDWLCQNTIVKGSTPAPSAEAAASADSAEAATYTSEPAETEAETTTENPKPQNEEFSNM